MSIRNAAPTNCTNAPLLEYARSMSRIYNRLLTSAGISIQRRDEFWHRQDQASKCRATAQKGLLQPTTVIGRRVHAAVGTSASPS